MTRSSIDALTADVPTATADVLVAGAGPAGCVVAGLLAQQGVKVWLCDRQEPTAISTCKIGESLPPAARPLLRSLNFEKLADQVSQPANGTLSVWASEQLDVVDYMFQAFGNGWTLDRPLFEQRLREWARECGATLMVKRIDGRALALEGASAPARMIIDASGRAATIGTLKSPRTHVDRLLAFYCRFRSHRGDDHDCRVLVEATKRGWWYTVRVPNGERLVAFLTDADLLEPRDRCSLPIDETRFIAATLQAFSYTPLQAIRGADARTSRLRRFAGPGWLAVGDAAFSVDPLSSQGMVDAMLSAKLAVPTILRMLAGDDSAAHEYNDKMDRLYNSYITASKEVYAREKRWPDASFWARRCEKGATT